MNHFDFTGCRIAVVGDLMLDKYLSGSVERLSPEAPVPVLLREAERAVLGGAANVCANLAALGAEVTVIGVIGRDDAGSLLLDLLRAHPKLRADLVVTDLERPTTCKIRVMSGAHQMVRIDAESRTEVAAEVEDAVASAIRHSVRSADVVVLSDYAKGLCSDRIIRTVIDTAADAGKAAIIDPKRRDFSIYRDATLIKPNRRELAEATRLPCESDQQAEAAALAAIAQTNSAILLTRSEHGMSFFERDSKPLHLKTAAQDVFDVSGAGDTVLAVAALGTAARLPVGKMMRFANAAAGIVVSKIGTAVVSAKELDEALEAEAHGSDPNKGASLSLEEAVRRREEWRKRGLRVGFTNGCYDLLHPGHVSLLKSAAAECDRLMVAINSDASVRRLKGPTRPVQDERSRAYILGALTAVDLVVVFDDDTPAETIAALQPDLLVKGADYAIDEIVGADTVRSANGRVLLVPLVRGQSSTSLIRRAVDLQANQHRQRSQTADS
ncbi:MAG: D-glycero-beta-D-manno-heptose-7-phosphate kinase [Alphaproteobacteria bacterium]|nr:D-glycero-beta-D-manno-heptose-7-phosphate kinase [Alphaproteobacteria bacterium]MBV9377807.1 D-glycero-beta-D-manno-heptose-7-phosphate kinase [Alphaproteobacteria bacterium]